MRTIVVNNQKGGVGKTMLSVHLSWYLAESAERVVFIDLDGQGNGSGVLQDVARLGDAADLFEEGTVIGEVPRGLSVLGSDARLHSVAVGGIRPMVAALDALGGVADYCVIDTPPTWCARNFAALAAADHVLAPVELKDFAFEGIRQLIQTMRAVEARSRQGRALDFLGVLASRYNSHSPRERANLERLVETVGPGMMFPGVVTARDGYEQAMSERRPVWQIRTSSAITAAAELRRILAAAQARIDAPAGGSA